MKGFCRHEACLDLYGYFAPKYFGPRYRKVRVNWFLRGHPIGLMENVTIQVAHLPRWKRCTDEGVIL